MWGDLGIMNKWVTLSMNLICLAIGQFVASKILDDASKLWGWSEAYSHFVVKSLLMVQGFLQAALTVVAHHFNPDGSKSENKPPQGGE